MLFHSFKRLGQETISHWNSVSTFTTVTLTSVFCCLIFLLLTYLMFALTDQSITCHLPQLAIYNVCLELRLLTWVSIPSLPFSKPPPLFGYVEKAFCHILSCDILLFSWALYQFLWQWLKSALVCVLKKSVDAIQSFI